MNQNLIFMYASTVVRKITAYQLYCAGLARSPFVLTEHISSYIVLDDETPWLVHRLENYYLFMDP